jgi:putative DNA primase/helicase
VTEETKPEGETPEPKPTDVERMEVAIARLDAEFKAKFGVAIDPSWLPVYVTGVLGTVINKKEFPQLDRNADGHPGKIQLATLGNIAEGLRQMRVTARVNMMDASVSIVLPPSRVDRVCFGSMTDADIDRLALEGICDVFATAGIRDRTQVKKLVGEMALANRFHPMLDLVKATHWDGQDHYSRLLGSVKCADHNGLAIYLRRWLLQTVECFAGWQKRTKSQKALALVFVGRQGIGKSRWFTSLVPAGMARGGVHLNLSGSNSRDSKHEALKQLVTELGEIATTTRKTDVADLKAFLADENDSYRLPYGAVWTDRPRCTSFAGSTNDAEPLVDTTGNRRFLIVEVEKCNPEHKIDLAQLWAQVHSWWLAGEPWWLTPDEEKYQTAQNEGHTQSDAVAELIEAEARLRTTDRRYSTPCGLGVAQVLKVVGLPYTHPQTCGKATAALAGLKDIVGTRRDLRAYDGADRAWVWMVSSDELRMNSLIPLRGGWQNVHQGAVPHPGTAQNGLPASVHDITAGARKRRQAGESAESVPSTHPARTSGKAPRKPRRPS